MIRVNDALSLDERDIEERFVRAAGPGGQNVNKVATAVELRFQLDGFSALPADVQMRLASLAGRRLTLGRVIVIQANAHRTQDRNRADAMARLIALVSHAAVRPKVRHKTRVPRAEKARRVESKVRRGQIKAGRGKLRDQD